MDDGKSGCEFERRKFNKLDTRGERGRLNKARQKERRGRKVAKMRMQKVMGEEERREESEAGSFAFGSEMGCTVT